MRWVYMEHSLPEGHPGAVKPSHCHPMYFRERDLHLSERYGCCLRRIKRTNEMFIDFGGMILVKKDKTISIPVGNERTVGLWEHQSEEVKHALENGSKFVSARGIHMRKIVRWPGVLCFLSEADVLKVLNQLKQMESTR